MDSISTFDGIVAVTFEFEMDRGEGPITTTFTLFSNGYYRYKKSNQDWRAIPVWDEVKTHDLELSQHYGIWDYKANRVIMEGMDYNGCMDFKSRKDEDDEYTDYEDDNYTDYYESEEEEDSELDDETMSIPEIEGVTYLFDFFRKEMVIEDPLAVRVHVY